MGKNFCVVQVTKHCNSFSREAVESSFAGNIQNTSVLISPEFWALDDCARAGRLSQMTSSGPLLITINQFCETRDGSDAPASGWWALCARFAGSETLGLLRRAAEGRNGPTTLRRALSWAALPGCSTDLDLQPEPRVGGAAAIKPGAGEEEPPRRVRAIAATAAARGCGESAWAVQVS